MKLLIGLSLLLNNILSDLELKELRMKYQYIQMKNEELKQNEPTNQQGQYQIDQVEQEKNDLQAEIIRKEVRIKELNSSLIERKKELSQLKAKLSHNHKVSDLKIADSNLKITELENEIARLKQKILEEEQAKMKLYQKVNELKQKLANHDYDRIKKLTDERKELVNKLICEENAKKILNQANKLLKTKNIVLKLQGEAIDALQDCLENSTNNQNENFLRNFFENMPGIKNNEFAEKFQNISEEYKNGLLLLENDYKSLSNIVKDEKDLKVSLIIENIFNLNSFNPDKYKIFQSDTNMKVEDINLLKKNLGDMKSELKQEEKELKNLED
ncbi:hypothetical protein RhiirA4_506727 [Rhizophagus irregularis]|uniref:Uncharacterized protein n=1 Tax=Rhizophagus irregularis TaxID=588596 RepID=A0A2I1HBL4_9GLOM|nr:hypothetical protein RhiirA4_506727 [Rhizophagus irregularis]